MKGSVITIEGIWEDIEKQAAKFSGRRVRVTFIPDSTHQPSGRRIPKPADESTARFLKEFAGSWVGDDLDECINMVGKTRSRTKW
jgi:hypothetical protein